MVYLLVTLSLGGKVQGRTRERNYDEDLYYHAIIPESETAQTVEEKRRPEVYQEEDTPKFNDYRLQDRGFCKPSFSEDPTPRHGRVQIQCSKGCRLTCVPTFK